MWRAWVLTFVLACAAEDAPAGDTDGGSSGSGGADAGPSSGPTGSAATTNDAASQTGAEATSVAETTDDPQTSDGSETGTDTGDVGSPGCGSDTLDPGTHSGLTLTHDDIERSFDIYVPSNYDPDVPTTLVLNFHGFTSTSGQQALFAQMNPFADERGVVVAYPQGTDNSWNAGLCCGTAVIGNVDDVGFAQALVEHISTMLCISPRRVFATGMSNGGYMSHRLACEAGDVFAAIAPVAGVIGVPTDTCTGRPVPVMHFHGTLDTLVPYDGGIAPSVDETIDFWTSHNGCTSGPEVTFEQGDTTCETWSDCSDGADVVRCRIEGGGHCWPGNEFCPFGASTTEIHASEAALDFFAEHPMP